MRQFEIRALVDERSLWDAMRYLESIRAQGIVSRPYQVEGPDKAEELAAPVAIARRFKTTGKAAEARAAILAALAKAGGPMTCEMIGEQAGGKLPLNLINAQARVLLASGAPVRRVSHGVYASAANGAAPLALPAPNGTGKRRVLAAVVAALANGGTITNKAIRESGGGVNKSTVDQALWHLAKDGYLKRVSPGTYVKGRKELAS